jgi:poly-gamma-glutamate capsule biosynthesis protein CapA/YwtB (metallophosphatase superfamily)
VTAKRIAVKRYVVKLSEAERERLNTLIHAGKHPARQLTRARILLKADSSEAGDAWSDSQIATALDTSVDTVARTRQQLVEEGLEAVLVRKHSPASARTRIFDGATEAKLIALACSEPPKGRKRWTLQLLEEHVVELKIVDRASDNTIGRTLKKTFLNLTCRSNG